MLTTKLLPFLIIAILSQIYTIHGLRILGIFPVQAQSHFVMCGTLMKELAARGHEVDVYSPFPLKKPIANYTDYSLAGSIESFTNNMPFNFVASLKQDCSIPTLLEFLGKALCELMNLPVFQKLIKNPPNDPPYDLVITELFYSNCYLAWGRYLKVPMIGLSTMPLFEWHNEPLGNPVNLATDPSVYSGLNSPMTFFDRLYNFLFSNYRKIMYNYYAREQDDLVRKLFGADIPDVIELQKDFSLVLINYHIALNGVRSFTPGVVPVGGIHIVDSGDELSKEVQKFLDDSKDGLIYVSFGSMARLETFPAPVLDAFYYTFKKIAPVRVLLKIAKPEELPPGLPPNVMTQTWFPQVKVLKHKNVKCFITHGGLMGTQESIYHGVPMVAVPLFGDQYHNVEMYVRKNLALMVELTEITRQSLYRAVHEVLTNLTYKTATEKVGLAFRDNPMSPLDTSIFWIEYIARHGKDALRSPIVDMPWYQSSLLDVYAFIIIIVILLVKIMKIFMKTLLKVVFRRRNTTSKVKKTKAN